MGALLTTGNTQKSIFIIKIAYLKKIYNPVFVFRCAPGIFNFFGAGLRVILSILLGTYMTKQQVHITCNMSVSDQIIILEIVVKVMTTSY